MIPYCLKSANSNISAVSVIIRTDIIRYITLIPGEVLFKYTGRGSELVPGTPMGQFLMWPNKYVYYGPIFYLAHGIWDLNLAHCSEFVVGPLFKQPYLFLHGCTTEGDITLPIDHFKGNGIINTH